MILRIAILACLLPCIVLSQTIRECRQRFDTYLNFRGLLTSRVHFDEEAIYLLDAAGKKELAVYAPELTLLASFFECSTLEQQQAFFKWKGNRRLTQHQRDSLLIAIDKCKAPPAPAIDLPLHGYRIAIDPGHFSTNLKDAAIEQKYLYYAKDTALFPNDSVKLFESALTFNTAKHLQAMLEAQGAQVMLTRDGNNCTSFNCTYPDWLRQHKTRMLDSLKEAELITPQRYAQLIKHKDYKLFWDFFRDYDLANRANKINQFNPHVTVIIHYNVDETNAPWKKGSDKNFTMAFIGGAFTNGNLDKPESKINFLRLLLTTQLNRSEKLAAATVANFHKNLHIPVATASDAVYLKENCLATSSPGVFARNLILCRKINSVLVYGESLYQDNKSESGQLMKSDLDVFGIKSNQRLNQVAKSYYDAVFDFLKNYPAEK